MMLDDKISMIRYEEPDAYGRIVAERNGVYLLELGPYDAYMLRDDTLDIGDDVHESYCYIAGDWYAELRRRFEEPTDDEENEA